MQLLENGNPLCPVLSIKDANRTEFVLQVGSIIPLSANSVFYIITPKQPSIGLGIKHSIAFPAKKKIWDIEVNESVALAPNFLSTIVFLGQADL